MSLLRIHVDQLERTEHCQWALLDDNGALLESESDGRLADLAQRVQRTQRVQLVLAASQVLIVRARIPRRARRGAASVLAFAVEERIASDPAANQVTWLGGIAEGDGDDQGDADMAALAVVDKPGLAGWCAALAALGLHVDAIHGETLMLPLQPGEWSLAWNGREGFVRCGVFEGRATDGGGRDAPPLSLRLMLDEASADGTRPSVLAVHVTRADAAPDVLAWQQALGIRLRQAGRWDWRSATAEVGASLDKPGPRWQVFSTMALRLRAAAWILAAALVLHALALMIDWNRLVGERQALRQQMESQFRESFPAALAVADPVLQMRRKLAEARHRVGQADSSDFLPLLAHVTAAAKILPPGVLQVMSHEGGQMRLELVTEDARVVQQFAQYLQQAGLHAVTSMDTNNSLRAVHVLTVDAP